MLRRSPRALALWAAALAVAVVTAVVVGGDLAALHRRAAGLGPVRDALVATRDLAVGDTVADGDLAVRRVHAREVPSDVASDRASARGRVVAVAVLRGEFVPARALAARRRTGLDGIVPAGLRAIRVVVTDAIRPRAGAAVDVLATDAGATGGHDASSTTVVAAGVPVLGTDQRAASGGGRAGAFGVTLLVTPDEARALAGAEAAGVVTLALVPPEEATR